MRVARGSKGSAALVFTAGSLIALAKPFLILFLLAPVLTTGGHRMTAQADSPVSVQPRLALASRENLLPIDFQLTGLYSAVVAPSDSLAVPLARPDGIRAESFPEPAGCRRPPDDYEAVLVGERILSRRTLSMLEYAQTLYAGQIRLAESVFVPPDSFRKESVEADPPSGPGVVKLTVTDPQTGRIEYSEIDVMIRALRVAGFAAWVRQPVDGTGEAQPYIHAISIGERGLSPAALEQLTGKFGYFLGRQGLSGVPDPYGGPILCNWMGEPGTLPGGLARLTALSSVPWETRLREVAESFITSSPDETAQLARSLDFMSGGYEHPSNMCGPLSAAILRAAGLLPWTVGPVAELSNYWLADPATNGRPWSLFPTDGYELHQFRTNIHRFDFGAWPLQPGDFVFTYAGSGSFSHMFVVSEVDEQGRAYSVTNMLQTDGSYLVKKVLLYDTTNGQPGKFEASCEDCVTWKHHTGLGGFDVLRRNSVELGPPAIERAAPSQDPPA